MTAASISFFSAIFKSAATGAIAPPRPCKADPPSTGGTSSLARWKSFSPRSCSTNSFPFIVPSAADFIESLFLREQTSRIIVQDFPLGLFFERECQEALQVSLDFGHARPGPVGSPEHLGGNLFQAREVYQQLLRGNPGNIHVHILVAPHEKKSLVHPQRAAAVSENHHEVREIDADIVGKHGLGMDVARAGKDRSARVNHHGHTIGLRSFVNSGEPTEPIAIGDGPKNL